MSNNKKQTINRGIQWYVVTSQAQKEKSTSEMILKTIKNKGLGDKVLDVFVPEMITEVEKVTKDGIKKTIRRKALYPRYIFIKMIMNDETWYSVRNSEGVTGIIGSGNHPIPIKVSEFKELQKKEEKNQEFLKAKDEFKTFKKEFKTGNKIVFNEGEFKGMEGEIKKINNEESDKGFIDIIIKTSGDDKDISIKFKDLNISKI